MKNKFAFLIWSDLFRCKLFSCGIGLKGNSPLILLFGSRDGVSTVSRNDPDVFFMFTSRLVPKPLQPNAIVAVII